MYLYDAQALNYQALMVGLARKFNPGMKMMAESWVHTMADIARSVKYVEGLPWDINLDWLRDAAMAAVELGLPLRPEPILELLTNRDYFESLLPMPVDDPRWQIGALSGTEILWQWWQLYPEAYRVHQVSLFEKVLLCIPENASRCFASYQLIREVETYPKTPDKKPDKI